MISFDATFFDGKTSQAHRVTVFFDGVSLSIRGETGGIDMKAPIMECSIDPPLGRTKRSVRITGGALLQTDDRKAVDRLGNALGVNRSWNLVHFIESHWKAVAACMAGLVLFLAAVVYYGIPYMSNRVAHSIPPKVTASASNETLKMFDRKLLGPSALPAERQAEVEGVFREVAGALDPDRAGAYTIVFRSGKNLGANAFALPSGTIIATDELVSISGDNNELAGVFAHEIAHVKKRHALRQILQSTGIFFLISLVTGDVTSITNFAAFLPTLLIESGYSRDFEKEADREAGLYLISKGPGTKPFRDLLEKLDASHPGELKLGVFSSHPETVRRIEYLKELERTR